MALLRRPTSAGGPRLTVHAPAKVNLSLDVLGRRPDGFHELRTVMATAGWYDTLTFEPADTWSLSVTGAAGVPTDGRNLVSRAATALAAAAGRSPSGAVRLHKRIPHEAGLGGGSADAAAALLGLNALWDCGLPRAALAEIAAGVGSDVPFFLTGGGAAVCGGRGERIDPLPRRAGPWAVVAKPPAGLSTAAVFAAWGGATGDPSTDRVADAWRGGDWAAVGRNLSNHLDAPAVSLHPALAAERDVFRRCGMSASCLTGSGTSRFALLPTAAAARRSAALAAPVAARAGRGIGLGGLAARRGVRHELFPPTERRR